MAHAKARTERVRRTALALGFEKFGAAPAGPAPRGAFLREWLARGFHGQMRSLTRRIEERLDPRRYLPGARSVVVVAKNYFTGPPRLAGPLEGTVARYAWGTDYHEVVGAKLRDLARAVQAEGGRARPCVDTAPILEKPWAQQAGLGWQGKHSCLVTEDLGSWLFLGEIVTDLELAYDAPAQDRCEACTRCLEACPTGAIVAPYVVDARRCLSYHTIEQRGAIPPELRAAMGNRVFGCDLCQEACPWNRLARPAPDSEFRARDGNDRPALAELVALSEAEFGARFGASPIRRAGRAGLARNAAVALGDSGRPQAAAPLAGALEDADPLVRAHVAWAWGRIGGAGAGGGARGVAPPGPPRAGCARSSPCPAGACAAPAPPRAGCAPRDVLEGCPTGLAGLSPDQPRHGEHVRLRRSAHFF